MFSGNAWHLLALRWFDDAKSWKRIGNVGLTVFHMFSVNAWHLLALRCLWWCKKLKEDWECRINGCSHVFRQCLTFVERERKIWKRIGYVRLTVVYMFYGNAWHLLALRWIWWCKNLKEDWECRITGCLHVFRQCLTSVSITLSLMMQKVERGLGMSD